MGGAARRPCLSVVRHVRQRPCHYAQRLDKEWSLTDCITFAVMAREGLTDALTGDHHFEQAGFVALLK
jgi:predicted nucleic acid-binding protein